MRQNACATAVGKRGGGGRVVDKDEASTVRPRWSGGEWAVERWRRVGAVGVRAASETGGGGEGGGAAEGNGGKCARESLCDSLGGASVRVADAGARAVEWVRCGRRDGGGGWAWGGAKAATDAVASGAFLPSVGAVRSGGCSTRAIPLVAVGTPAPGGQELHKSREERWHDTAHPGPPLPARPCRAHEGGLAGRRAVERQGGSGGKRALPGRPRAWVRAANGRQAACRMPCVDALAGDHSTEPTPPCLPTAKELGSRPWPGN